MIVERSPYLRTSRHRPCPICGHRDWCGFTADGSKSVCMRISQGAKGPSKNGGWVHILRESDRRSIPPSAVIRPVRPRPEWEPFIKRCAASAELPALARQLNLSVDGLQRYEAGRCTGADLIDLGTPCRRDRWHWVFPMRNIAGDLLGVRVRAEDGSKFAVSGSHEGLFVPVGLTPGGRLLIAEGVSDACALADMGFDAIGRPSALGGLKLTVAAVKRLRPDEVSIVADGDGPGRQGARVLAVSLAIHCRMIRVLTPPPGVKDARAWKLAGATMADVVERIEQTPLMGRKVVAA